MKTKERIEYLQSIYNIYRNSPEIQLDIRKEIKELKMCAKL